MMEKRIVSWKVKTAIILYFPIHIFIVCSILQPSKFILNSDDALGYKFFCSLETL